MSAFEVVLHRHFDVDAPTIAMMVRFLEEANTRGATTLTAAEIQAECRQLQSDARVMQAATEILKRRARDIRGLEPLPLNRRTCITAADTTTLLALVCEVYAEPAVYRAWKDLPPENEAQGGADPRHTAVWPALLFFWQTYNGEPKYTQDGPLVRCFRDVYTTLGITPPSASALRKLLPRWHAKYAAFTRGRPDRESHRELLERIFVKQKPD